MHDKYNSNYESDWTANTQNLEAPYDCNVNSTEFDTSASVDSNGAIDGVPRQNDLNVNAAATSNSILRYSCRGRK